MTEETGLQVDLQADSGGDVAPPAPGTTAGSYLRAAREAAGLHIGALAVSLKVPVKKLEALEADRIDLLPDAVFARALAASVCRTLKLDPAAVLRLLPEHHKPSLQIAGRVSAAAVPMRSAGRNQALLSRVSKPVLAIAAVILLAAVVVFAYPAFKQHESSAEPAAADATGANAPVALGAGVSPAASVEPSSVAGTPAVLAPLPAAAPAISVAPSPAMASPASAPATPAAQEVATPTGAEPLSVKARSSTWIQVTDANGVSRLRKTLAQGETAAITGALPLSVVVGRADAAEVTVRGAAMDLTAVTRDNVARFQVK